MKLFNYSVEVNLHARWSWSHFKIHKYPLYWHIVWGRVSAIVGQPHLEEMGICSECSSTDIGEVSAGDEGWTVCQDCGTIEGGYEYITVEEAEKRGIL